MQPAGASKALTSSLSNASGVMELPGGKDAHLGNPPPRSVKWSALLTASLLLACAQAAFSGARNGA